MADAAAAAASSASASSSAPLPIDEAHLHGLLAPTAHGSKGFDVDSLDAALVTDAAVIAALRAAVASVKVEAGDLPYWGSSHCLHRFLVARGMDVRKAADMYTHTMAHRASRKCSALLDGVTYTQPEVVRKCFPWGLVGLDKQGFPVLVERIGAIDLVGMQAAMSPDEFLQWVCFYHELQERAMRRVCDKLGKSRHKMTCIIDCGGVSMRHLSAATLGVLKRRVRLEEDNYPEVVKRVFLVNTPALFATVWGVIKVFMDPGTTDKMRILGSGYMPILREFVDDAVIPAYLGGGLRDGDGDAECKSLVCGGGLVPLAYLVGVATDGKGWVDGSGMRWRRRAESACLCRTCCFSVGCDRHNLLNSPFLPSSFLPPQPRRRAHHSRGEARRPHPARARWLHASLGMGHRRR